MFHSLCGQSHRTVPINHNFFFEEKEEPKRNERKHGALRPQTPLRLLRDGEVGGSGILMSNTYSLHCHHQNDSALRWAAV